MANSTERIGTTIGDRYEITRLIGEGGMGVVYGARHRFTKRRVAIKVLLPEYANNAEFVARFLREAQSATAINHANIVQVLDMGVDGSHTVYLVLEFLDGEDLGTRLAARQRLHPMEALQLLLPVMDALASAHSKGIIHRDLKPANIFLARQEDGTIVPKLLDFGISKVTGGDDLGRTSTGMILGTPYYMAPEQARGDRNVDSQVDVWAMGVVLYQCLSGRLPFLGENYNQMIVAVLTQEPPPLSALVSGIPLELAQVVSRALAKDRAVRFATMEQFASSLRSIQRNLSGVFWAPPADPQVGIETTVDANSLRRSVGLDGPPTAPPSVSSVPSVISANAPSTALKWSGSGASVGPTANGSKGTAAVLVGLLGAVAIGLAAWRFTVFSNRDRRAEASPSAARFDLQQGSQSTHAAATVPAHSQVAVVPANAPTTTPAVPATPTPVVASTQISTSPAHPAELQPNAPAIDSTAGARNARSRGQSAPTSTAREDDTHVTPTPVTSAPTPRTTIAPVNQPPPANVAPQAPPPDAGQPATATPAIPPAGYPESPPSRASLRAAATSALSAVEPRIRACVRTSVGISVSFAATGSIRSVVVLPPHAGTTAEPCIVAAVRTTTIPPFPGNAYDIVHQYRATPSATVDPVRRIFVPAIDPER